MQRFKFYKYHQSGGRVMEWIINISKEMRSGGKVEGKRYFIFDGRIIRSCDIRLYRRWDIFSTILVLQLG